MKKRRIKDNVNGQLWFCIKLGIFSKTIDKIFFEMYNNIRIIVCNCMDLRGDFFEESRQNTT